MSSSQVVAVSPTNEDATATTNGGNHAAKSSLVHKQSSLNSLRHIVTRSERRFDVTSLPADMLRVYRALESDFGEEYALLFVFNMTTGIELHRGWHMTLLTSKILQRVKDTFGLRMTWNLGVVRLKFRVEDGGYELHRKVPYDYDSEFQDLYMRIAYALCEGHITVHEALLYQSECKLGRHTASSGMFLRDFPGRLVLYPLLASTCAVIFFGGSWRDAGVAAICGLATGLFEYALSTIGGEAKILIDIFAGMLTGVIGCLFYRYDTWDDGESKYCLSAIFLGTLYWFFYGTAFVLGLLEIIAGELETGVTRFMAVSIKTFVLCLMASFGMLITLGNNDESASTVWQEQADNCGTIDLDTKWWRIPLYLACSVAALGQYRFRVVEYWRGLAVQLVAYEVQYQVTEFFVNRRGETDQDNLDTAASNILGAASAVVTACLLSWIVDFCMKRYYGQLLQRGVHRDETPSKVDDWLYGTLAAKVHFFHAIKLGDAAEVGKLKLERKLREQTTELKDPNHPRCEIRLDAEEEDLLLDTIVDAESMNIWAMLMPAVYQLVPGSMIAKLWFNSIFPPRVEMEEAVTDEGVAYSRYKLDSVQDNVFSNLMVISISLALGLIIGFAIVQTYEVLFSAVAFWETDEVKEKRKEERDLRAGMYTAVKDESDDPDADPNAKVPVVNVVEEDDETPTEGGGGEESPAPNEE